MTFIMVMLSILGLLVTLMLMAFLTSCSFSSHVTYRLVFISLLPSTTLALPVGDVLVPNDQFTGRLMGRGMLQPSLVLEIM